MRHTIKKAKKALSSFFSWTALVTFILILGTVGYLISGWLEYIYLDVLGLPPIGIGGSEDPQECLNLGTARDLWFAFLLFAMYFFYLLIKKLDQMEEKISRIAQDACRPRPEL